MTEFSQKKLRTQIIKPIKSIFSERLAFLIICFIFALPVVSAELITGKVVGVIDGDTLRIIDHEKNLYKIRLSEIDSPESGQPYGKRAKQQLSRLVYDKQVDIKVIDIDRYGRVVGRVFVEGVDVNSELVRIGSAWVYRKYALDLSLFELEKVAKQKGRGLWGLDEVHRLPPWDWRHSSKHPSIKQEKNHQNLKCGDKKKCNHMLDCEEANYYMKSCGISSLDGDGDGLPCESICR